MLDHVLLGAENDRAGRASFHARRLQADADTIRTQRALIGFAVFLGQARHIEGAAGNTVAAADAILLVEIHNAIAVLHDGAGGGAGFEATRIGAVHAAILAD